jgi:hypothetical protein
MRFFHIAVICVIIVAGCVQEEVALKEISIPGHNDIYTFSNDIRDALKVESNNPAAIKSQFYEGEMSVVFDGSSPQDNAYFTVVMTNIMAKVPTYLAYEGVLIKFQPYYFIGETWYNRNGDEIEKPKLANVLWLKGPSTGAEETSVNIINNTIILQGTSYQNLTLAGDRLVLEVMGINYLSG